MCWQPVISLLSLQMFMVKFIECHRLQWLQPRERSVLGLVNTKSLPSPRAAWCSAPGHQKSKKNRIRYHSINISKYLLYCVGNKRWSSQNSLCWADAPHSCQSCHSPSTQHIAWLLGQDMLMQGWAWSSCKLLFAGNVQKSYALCSRIGFNILERMVIFFHLKRSWRFHLPACPLQPLTGITSSNGLIKFCNCTQPLGWG